MIDCARVFLGTFQHFNDTKINRVWKFPSFFSIFSLRGMSYTFFSLKGKKKSNHTSIISVLTEIAKHHTKCTSIPLTDIEDHLFTSVMQKVSDYI